MMNEELQAISYDEFVESAWMPVDAGTIPPGTPVKLWEFTRGTREQMAKEADHLAAGTRRYLRHHTPTECWEIRVRPSDDPVGGYQVWGAYFGTMARPGDRVRWQNKRRSERRSKG